MLINSLNDQQNIASTHSEALINHESTLHQIVPSSCKGILEIHSELMSEVSKLKVDLNNATSVSPQSLQYESPQPFADRSLLTPEDHKVLNSIFYVTYDTETPSKSSIANIKDFYHINHPGMSDYQLDQASNQAKALYELRHIAKKGKYLDGSPIEGKSNYIADTTQAGRILRARAGVEVAEHPLPQQRSERKYEDFFNDIAGRIADKIKTDPESFKSDEITVSVRRPSKDYKAHDLTMNYLALGFQASLTNTLNAIAAKSDAISGKKIHFVDDDIFTTICRTTRAEADLVGRLGQLGYFSKKNIQPNEFIIIADDHVQSGDAMTSTYIAAKESKAQVVGVACYGIHPYSAEGLFDKQAQVKTQQLLADVDPNNIVKNALEKIGVPLDQLNIFEAIILQTLLTDGKNQEPIMPKGDTTKKFHPTLPAEHDDLEAFIYAPAITPEQLALKLENEVNANRKVLKEV